MCGHEYELVLVGPEGATTVMATARELRAGALDDRPELEGVPIELVILIEREDR